MKYLVKKIMHLLQQLYFFQSLHEPNTVEDEEDLHDQQMQMNVHSHSMMTVKMHWADVDDEQRL